MARVEDARGLVLDDDDIIEVQATRSGRYPNMPGNLFSQPTRAPRMSASLARERRPERRPRGPAAFIDLTEEPDSPPRRASQSQGRNPRRTASQRLSPPRLARSDSTFMGPPSFIDLTDESPDDEHALEPLRPSYPRAARERARQRPGLRSHDELIHLDFMEERPRLGGLGALAGGLAGRLAGILGADVMRNFRPPHLDVSRNPFVPAQPPKPPMEPAPPTRVGFTRDTRAESDDGAERVVVCPCCNEELAYDPSEPTVQMSTNPAYKKRKRAPGEHHFWAVKKCGHVYCADCFENRRPTKLSEGAGFPCMNGHPSSNPSDIRCAVDGCETKVVNKTEWVGIFL